MGHQAIDSKIVESFYCCGRVIEFIEAKAQPTHTCVNLQMYIDDGAGGGAPRDPDLPSCRNDKRLASNDI